MSATQKFVRFIFGQSGDRAPVPDATPVDGSVSYEQGFGFDYQRPGGDSLKKNVERDRLNQILYDMTLGLRQYQTHGFPEYVFPSDNGGAPFAYSKNAYVRWTDGQIYVSLVDDNQNSPEDVTRWQLALLGTGVGAIQYFPAATPPLGYLKANGAVLLRSAYPVLWAFAQASGNLAASDGVWQSGQFSPGDGATTFRIPDMRGYEIRALDDGRGVDAGRVLGSVQADQMPSHAHAVNDGGHNHAVNDPGHGHGLADPGHGHGIDQTPHGHVINDPGHGHAINDPTHAHTLGTDLSGAQNLQTLSDTAGADESPTGALTGASATGISIVGNITNVSVQPGLANVAVGAAATGQSVIANASNIGLGASATGISIQPTGSGTEVRTKNIAHLACIKYL